MFLRLLLIIAVFTAVFYFRKRWQNTLPENRKGLLLNWALWTCLAAVTIMALTGRIHWIGAALALCVPFAKQVGLWFMQRKLQGFSNKDSESQAVSTAPLNEDSARKLLDLDVDYDRSSVIAAHRKMMQKNHPDQGGSDYLAAMINQAKEVLLEKLGPKK